MTKTHKIGDVVKALRKARSVVVIPHEDPDGDSLGSGIGIGILMEKLGAEVTYFSKDRPSRIYDFLPRIDRFSQKLPQKGPADIGVVCDCGDVKRIGEGVQLRKLARSIINIDHHLENGLFGDINFIEHRSSTAELVSDICQKMKIMTKEMATALYTGIMMDTGSFRYDNTTAETFRIATDLVAHGANPFQIAAAIFERKNLAGLQVLGEILTNLDIREKGKVAAGSLTQGLLRKVGADTAELPQMADILRSIDGVEVAVFFREISPENIKVNFRSKHWFNVQRVAKMFGGGGHFKASACVAVGKLEEVREKVLQEICRQIQQKS